MGKSSQGVGGSRRLEPNSTTTHWASTRKQADYNRGDDVDVTKCRTAHAINKLNTEIVRILRLPEITKRLATQGVDVVASSPEEFAAFIRQDVAKYAKLVKTAGIRID